MSNFEMFMKTVNSLRVSQGFYSRMARDIENMDEDGRANLESYTNSQPPFKDSVDVVLFLEQ